MAESFHSNNNRQFYKQHANHQNVINILMEIQTETNLKINRIERKITNKWNKEIEEKQKFVQIYWKTYEIEQIYVLKRCIHLCPKVFCFG